MESSFVSILFTHIAKVITCTLILQINIRTKNPFVIQLHIPRQIPLDISKPSMQSHLRCPSYPTLSHFWLTEQGLLRQGNATANTNHESIFWHILNYSNFFYWYSRHMNALFTMWRDQAKNCRCLYLDVDTW